MFISSRNNDNSWYFCLFGVTQGERCYPGSAGRLQGFDVEALVVPWVLVFMSLLGACWGWNPYQLQLWRTCQNQLLCSHSELGRALAGFPVSYRHPPDPGMTASVSIPAGLSSGFLGLCLESLCNFFCFVFCVASDFCLALAPSTFSITEISTHLQLLNWALPYFLLLLWIVCYFSGA